MSKDVRLFALKLRLHNAFHLRHNESRLNFGVHCLIAKLQDVEFGAGGTKNAAAWFNYL